MSYSIKKKKIRLNTLNIFDNTTTPAITRVALCNKALTGVGPSIEFGNQTYVITTMDLYRTLETAKNCTPTSTVVNTSHRLNQSHRMTMHKQT